MQQQQNQITKTKRQENTESSAALSRDLLREEKLCYCISSAEITLRLPSGHLSEVSEERYSALGTVAPEKGLWESYI